MRPVAVVIAGCVAVATACIPVFNVAPALDFSAVESDVRVIWTPASDAADGHDIERYEVTANNVVVGNIAPPASACRLMNLAPSTNYDISVTAYSTEGEWSDNAPERGRLSGSFSSAPSASGGSTTCVTETDSDGDRLPDWAETNTGVFVDPTNTGTNPSVADTDGDSVGDGDEVLGTVEGLPLPAMGANPLRKSLFLEFDWMDDANDCGAHSHRPTPTAIAMLTAPYTNSPVANPDGSTGIDVISDYGQGGVFQKGNVVADADANLAGGLDGEFLTYKAANFDANRDGIFHYVMLPHRYNNSDSSGLAEVRGDDLIVSLYCANTDFNVATTTVHELGHNLGLEHGGIETRNYKPNYNSVMNYRYQFPGIDTDCNVTGNGIIDYSVGTRLQLNEADLDESEGVCGLGFPYDWNANSVIETSVRRDINQDGSSTGILNDHNDWANLYFPGIGEGDGARPSPPRVVVEQPVPEG